MIGVLLGTSYSVQFCMSGPTMWKCVYFGFCIAISYVIWGWISICERTDVNCIQHGKLTISKKSKGKPRLSIDSIECSVWTDRAVIALRGVN